MMVAEVLVAVVVVAVVVVAVVVVAVVVVAVVVVAVVVVAVVMVADLDRNTLGNLGALLTPRGEEGGFDKGPNTAGYLVG